MDFPKGATTDDKIFLKQCYLDNLESQRSQAQDQVDEYREQMKDHLVRISEIKAYIRSLTKEINNVENTKVD